MERLIINGIDFDQRLDDAKMFLHFRINSIWFNHKFDCHQAERRKRMRKMLQEQGIFIQQFESNPEPDSWYREMLERRLTAYRFGGYQVVWPKVIILPPTT